MNHYLAALAHDVAGQYEQAAAAYEQAIGQPQAPVEAFANLSFIYWEASAQQSMTFANGTAVPLAWGSRSFDSCFRVLAAGLQRYPQDLELSFWSRYFPYRGVFNDFSAADCQQLLATCTNHNHTLMPWFFLSLFDENQYRAEVTAILAACARQPTAKNRWVASILHYKPFTQA